MEFFRYITHENLKYKVGFDSCSVPALIRDPGETDLAALDTCEGARWSAYVSPDFSLLPCSFDNQERRWAVSLRDHSVEEAWNSRAFEDFRDRFRNACPGCRKRGLCMGGCPIRPEIVLCSKNEKTN